MPYLKIKYDKNLTNVNKGSKRLILFIKTIIFQNLIREVFKKKCEIFHTWGGGIDQEILLNFSKLILLFPLVHFKRLKRALMQNLHFYRGHPIVALKGLRKTVEAYIIKWTTSSEPPVDLKSLQDSK